MITRILIGLILGLAFVNLIFNVLSLLFANVYDVQATRKSLARLKHPYGKWRRYRPVVSIIVPAHNEAAVIVRCLESIVKNSYRKYELIVVDDASTDSTSPLVREFINKYPKKEIRLIRKRRNVGKGGAINTALGRYTKGELIMTLDADSVLDRKAIRNAVKYFSEATTTALAANVRILTTDKILGALQKFEYLVSYRGKKFYTSANCEYIIGGVGAMYRRALIGKVRRYLVNVQTEDIAVSLALAKMGNKANRLVYASDVLLYTEPVPTYRSLLRQRYRWKLGALQAIYINRSLVLNPNRKYSKMLTWFRLPMALWSEFMLFFEPLYFVLFLSLAVANHNPALYIGACTTLMLILLINIWDDEHYNLSERLIMSVIAPTMYPLFFVMTTVQVTAVFRCLVHYKSIVGRDLEGRWVSPERLGSLINTVKA